MRRPVTPRSAAALLCAASLGSALMTCAAAALAAEGDLSQLADRLTSLRGEVEGLHEQLEAHKAQTQLRLRALGAQRVELEAQLEREQLRLKQLQQARQRHLDRVAQSERGHEHLKPAVLANIELMRAQIKTSLPFKLQERLAELDTLEQQLHAGMLSPHKAAARQWQLVEDELRLTRESGLYQQVLPVQDQDTLVEVARLGMIAMYWRSQDGRVGLARRTPQGWRFEAVLQPEAQAQIVHLFESFKKGLRVGEFSLPEALIDPSLTPPSGAAPEPDRDEPRAKP